MCDTLGVDFVSHEVFFLSFLKKDFYALKSNVWEQTSLYKILSHYLFQSLIDCSDSQQTLLYFTLLYSG